MQQSSALYNPIASATPEQRKIFQQTKERRDRFAQKAVVQSYVAQSEKVEPRSLEPVVVPEPAPAVEVIANNGQVVRVTQEQIAEAWAMFEAFGYDSYRRPTVDFIVRKVCEHFDVRKTDLISARRTKDLVVPRQVVMYLAKTLTVKSLPEIGRRLGGRDHTTVLHAVRKMASLVERGDKIAEVISKIRISIVGIEADALD